MTIDCNYRSTILLNTFLITFRNAVFNRYRIPNCEKGMLFARLKLVVDYFD